MIFIIHGSAREKDLDQARLDSHGRLQILVTDIWTDRNKGDLALNLGIIRVLRKSFPTADISVCSLFGANQMKVAMQESSFTRRENIRFFAGGLFPTYHVLNPRRNRRAPDKIHRVFRPFRLMCSIEIAFLLLVAAFCKLERVVCYLLPREFRRSLEVFSSADIIVSRRSVVPSSSGGFTLLEPYIVFKELYHACLAIIMRKPLVLLGYSIWPLTNPLSRKLVKWVLNKSILVTLREELSCRYVKQIGVDMSNVHVLPDLSLAVCTDSRDRLKPYPRNRVKPIIGFALVDWRTGGERKRDNYINVMADFTRYVADKHNFKVCIVAQVVYPPQDPREIAELIGIKSGEKDIEFIWNDFCLEELLNLYSHFDFTVAAPLHSGIFSLCTGTPVVFIAYDGGPKHLGVSRMLGVEDCVLSYDDLKVESLIKAFEKAWSQKSRLHEKALSRTEVLGREARTYESLLKKKFACFS